LGLSNEHAAEFIRNRTVNEARSTSDGRACAGLSPLSILGCGVEAALCVNGCGWLFERDDELPLCFGSGCALELPIAGNITQHCASNADNHG
jgi:hypothetical protein